MALPKGIDDGAIGFERGPSTSLKSQGSVVTQTRGKGCAVRLSSWWIGIAPIPRRWLKTIAFTSTTDTRDVVAITIDTGAGTLLGTVGCGHHNAFRRSGKGLRWQPLDRGGTPPIGKQLGFRVAVGPSCTNGTFSIVPQTGKRVHARGQHGVQIGRPNVVGILAGVVPVPFQTGQGHGPRDFHGFVRVVLDGQMGILRCQQQRFCTSNRFLFAGQWWCVEWLFFAFGTGSQQRRGFGAASWRASERASFWMSVMLG